VIATMSVQDKNFWNLSLAAPSHFGHPVQSIDVNPYHIQQRNCKIRSLKLTLADGRDVHLVEKDTSLKPETFLDHVHFVRTKKAYGVELNFYKYFAHFLRDSPAKIPYCYFSSSEGSDFVLILDDLSKNCQSSSDYCERDCQKGELDEDEARLALEWLSSFHAAFVGVDIDDKLWPKGSYWSLDKRQKEWKSMKSEWSKTCSSFADKYPSLFSRSSVVDLARNLSDIAEDLDRQLIPSPKLKTLLHGDFKSANFFFDAEGISVCDFQWTGPGLGVLDAVYLLYSSVKAEVVFTKAEDLLYFYFQKFLKKASERGFDLDRYYEWTDFERHTRAAFLDYVRFLVGSMWGSITPTSYKTLDSKINHSIHKRNPDYLAEMVDQADRAYKELFVKVL